MDALPAAETTPHSPDPVPQPAQPTLTGWVRTRAAIQVFCTSGLPTQVLLMIALGGAGLSPLENGDLSLPFFALVGLLDTALVALLIQWFLTTEGESVRDVFLGDRSAWREAALGLAAVPLAFIGVLLVVLAIRTWAPSLHNVEVSPLDAFLRSPIDAAVFMVVAVLAGGVREELQRAFILHRFDQALGGIRVGLVVFSAYFGVFHYNQGIDVAIAIGLLGLAWGLIYARRRSVVLGMVNHAGFNALQVGQAVLARSMGVG